MRAPLLSVCLPVVLALATPRCTLAQVNTETLRSPDGDGFAMSLNSSFSVLAGNVEALDVGAGLRVDYRKETHYAFLVGSVQYAELGRQKYRERLFGHLRYVRDLTPRLASEVFGQAERDGITLLQARLLAGGGLRFRYVDKDQKRVGLFQGTALMYEYENLDAAKVVDHPATVRVARWSNYVNLRLNVSENTTFITTLYAQPRLDAFDDVRILGEAVLALAIIKHLTFEASFNLRYDSRPPGEVKKTDLSMRNGLTVSF